ncbi:MAG: class A beta-lactamase [Alphaproteobacteria bacterium]|nr:class A beta-lactamase [Alphaproteobacteria bacterium]
MAASSITRRAALRAALAGLAGPTWVMAAPGREGETPSAALARIEQRIGGRLGVSATRTGRPVVGWRADERFRMCSSFKLLLAAEILRRVDAGSERLDAKIAYGEADLQPYAPTTRAHLAEGALSVGELCRAAVTLSDNTAANLLLRRVGGPPAVTALARRLGDGVTRLDRWEPELNEGPASDLRDTTTPAAMGADLEALCLGTLLGARSRQQLLAWLGETSTGLGRLRAGWPKAARAGDKTGSNPGAGIAADVGLVWPPGGGPPLFAAVYTFGAKAKGPDVDAALAEVGAIVYRALA